MPRRIRRVENDSASFGRALPRRHVKLAARITRGKFLVEEISLDVCDDDVDMGLFDVYVEGATDAGDNPAALQRLAEVMSQRYGLPAGELQNRLAKGRFRVKANVDDATAQTYVRDLEAIGARVVLTEARGGSTLPPPTRPKPDTKPPPHPITVSPRQRNESRGSYSISRSNCPAPRCLTTNCFRRSLRPRHRQSHRARSPTTRSRLRRSEPLPRRCHHKPPRCRRVRPHRRCRRKRRRCRRVRHHRRCRRQTSLPPTSALPPRSGAPWLPPQTSLRTGGASNPPSNQPFASGLSAAFGESGPVDAAAFDSLSVGSLDDASGRDQSGVAGVEIGPPPARHSRRPTSRRTCRWILFAPPRSARRRIQGRARRRRRRASRTQAHAGIRGTDRGAAIPVHAGCSVQKGPQAERSAGVRMPSMSDDTPRSRYALGIVRLGPARLHPRDTRPLVSRGSGVRQDRQQRPGRSTASRDQHRRADSVREAQRLPRRADREEEVRAAQHRDRLAADLGTRRGRASVTSGSVASRDKIEFPAKPCPGGRGRDQILAGCERLKILGELVADRARPRRSSRT